MTSQELVPVELVGFSEDEMPNALDLVESAMLDGERVRITLCTEGLPSREDLDGIFLGMRIQGCHVSRPTARIIGGVATTEFVMQKGSPAFAAIIPVLVPLFIIGLITFGIFRIEAITKALVPLILITIGGLIILAVAISKPAAKYIERGGKVPLLTHNKPLALTDSKKALAAR